MIHTPPYILVVDDEPQFCNVLKEFLGSEDFHAEAAHTGLEAVELIKRKMPDAILLDMQMPGIDGIETLKRIRNMEKDCPVIMLTAAGDINTALTAISEGACAFLRKPVNFDELKLSIDSALEKKRLILENRDYQKKLEERVDEQTRSLKQMFMRLKKANLDIVRALTEAIDAKDTYTHGHGNRVTTVSLRIGRELGLSKEQLEVLEYGALLHDIGKIGIPGEILNKDGKLTDEEYGIIKTHPVIGAKIVTDVDFLKEALPIITSHHETYEGRGYPDGLNSLQMGIMPQIVSVADVYDALVSSRSYRKALAQEEAFAILKENKGKQFHPDIVDIFMKKKLYLLDL